MIRGVHKRLTYESKFSRYYATGMKRKLHHIKRDNRRKLRRILKKEMVINDDAA